MSTADRSSRGAHLGWTAIVGGLAVLGIVSVAVTRLMIAFGDGVRWEVTLPESYDSPAAPHGTSVQVTQGIVTVPDAGTGLLSLMILTVVVAALSGIAAIACYLVLTTEISRGRTFSRRAIRMLTWMATIVLVGTVACYLLDSAIGRGVRAAVGLDEVGGSTPLSYWMGFAIFAALSLITYAFRRGAVLQKETEGLV
ncbi:MULTISPECIES: DUF2975 domain-containing protein [unclassified Microbacterium]|uniref:DUF2975 domain-containing protein n=1 Tax=unclassified Microbacterium TaxID=2609290 RepID=UPI0012F9492B|nr:DUF2975 domain-containing protein [Microbacterium sp. MAH-37]MVQ43406.1 DUF2975 domain-containing protein [Microbacterium sp. MAH-37]